MIEEKNIRKLCGNNAVFNRGMDLYLDGNVKNIRYERKNRDSIEEIHILAKVKGSGIHMYQVMANII